MIMFLLIVICVLLIFNLALLISIAAVLVKANEVFGEFMVEMRGKKGLVEIAEFRK